MPYVSYLFELMPLSVVFQPNTDSTRSEFKAQRWKLICKTFSAKHALITFYCIKKFFVNAWVEPVLIGTFFIFTLLMCLCFKTFFFLFISCHWTFLHLSYFVFQTDSVSLKCTHDKNFNNAVILHGFCCGNIKNLQDNIYEKLMYLCVMCLSVFNSIENGNMQKVYSGCI